VPDVPGGAVQLRLGERGGLRSGGLPRLLLLGVLLLGEWPPPWGPAIPPSPGASSEAPRVAFHDRHPDYLDCHRARRRREVAEGEVQASSAAAPAAAAAPATGAGAAGAGAAATGPHMRPNPDLLPLEQVSKVSGAEGARVCAQPLKKPRR